MRESRIEAGGHVFTVERGAPLEVSMMRRPDTSWRFTDAAGHVHAWYARGKPAESYSPTVKLDLPTLRWVVTGTGYYPDGESYDIGHHECVLCGERVEPMHTSDTTRQYIPGLSFFAVDGHAVSEDEFKRIATEAGLTW
jgi:hypothetical protein